MSDLTFTANLVARSFDTNKNNQVQDEVKFTPAVLAKVDTDKNGQVSVAELTTAIEKDVVLIQNGEATCPKAKGKVTVANIMGATDALDAANTAIVSAAEQVKPLSSWNSGRANMVQNARLRNAELEIPIAMFTKAIAMSRDSWTGETIKDDTFYRAVNGRKDCQNKQRANNELMQGLNGAAAGPVEATLQSKAREVYDIGVSMTALNKTSSKSEIAGMKARLQAAASTVAAAGQDATGKVAFLNSAHIQ